MTARPLVDLRSDTVTKPTAAMKAAMFEAPIGDDMFADDPSANFLERKVAELLHKEAALFLPSGTMANQVAIHVHCRPGDQILISPGSHSILFETGATAALSGVQLSPVEHTLFTASDLEKLYSPGLSLHDSATSLVIVENTHNMAGGLPVPMEDLRDIKKWCSERSVSLHMDGARLFNASAASGVEASTYAEQVDTLTFCLSKGLGCPVGSVLVGSEKFISLARRARKRFGGAMRQIGMLCAAGTFALDHNVARLQEDHARASRLAKAWSAHSALEVPSPPTNMIYVNLVDAPFSAKVLQERLAGLGVQVLALSDSQIRAVTHLDVDDAGINQAIAAMASILS